MQTIENSMEKIAKKVEVTYTPAKVDVVGLASLKQAVDQVCKTYSGLVVTADSYKQDKKTAAELNKLKKALNDRKIEIKKQATKEVDQFADEVKAMTSELDDVVSQIRAGINACDEKAKAERTEAVKRRIADLCSEAHVSADDIEWDPSWANKSATWPKTGIMRNTLYLYKTGAVEPSDSAIEKIAKQLGINRDVLLIDESQATEKQVEARQKHREIRKKESLAQQEKHSLINTIDKILIRLDALEEGQKVTQELLLSLLREDQNSNTENEED